MTPEELDRTIDFIVRQQAQFSVDLQTLVSGIAEMQTAIKGLAGMQTELAMNYQQIVRVLEIQSRRLDRHEDWQRETQKRFEESQREEREHHREALARLDRILDRLTENDPKNN